MKTAQEYQKRLQRHLDELKWLYCELYPGREDMFTQLCEQMEAWYQAVSYTHLTLPTNSRV